MIKIYNKNKKKSIADERSPDNVIFYKSNTERSTLLSQRIDLFFILALLIFIVSPLVINLFYKLEQEIEIIQQINLLLSPRFEELFGEKITEELLQEFEEQNPDFRIRLLEQSDEKEADILFFDEGSYSTFAAGALVNQMVIPLVSFMDLLFYNIELLTTAGFDRPPKTREEFLSYAKAVSYEDDIRIIDKSGTALSLSQRDRQSMSRDIFSWIWSSGNDFWQDDQPAGNVSRRPVLNTRTIAADLSFLKSFYTERVLAPGIFDTTGEQRLEEFARGRIAMMIASTGIIPLLREKMGDDAFGITNIPDSGLGGKYNICLSYIYAGVNADCEYPDEAWNFVLFLAEKGSFFCEVLNAIPGVVSEIIPGNYVRDDPFYSKAWDIYESSFIVQGFSGSPDAHKYENAFLEELQAFFRSNRTAQDTVAAIQQRWDNISEGTE